MIRESHRQSDGPLVDFSPFLISRALLVFFYRSPKF